MTFGDLGYDPTVTRIRAADNNIQYQFEVNRKFYLAESFIAANDIVTRATRVWSVRECDPVLRDESVVLKDVWFFSDAQREKTIYDHPPRTHRRIVFAHHCTPLYELFDYAEYALAIVHILHGLNFLRIARFVHRNISPGNCLVFRDPSSGVIQAKILDLEYTHPYGTESSNDVPRTGTPGFMAVEYQCLNHLFRPDDTTPPLSHLLSTDFEFLGGETALHVPAVVTRMPKTTRWFRFNYLHDVESAIWLYCWLLFHRLPSSIQDKVSPSDCRKIGRFAQQLFGLSLEPKAIRRAFIEGLSVSCDVYKDVWELLQPFYARDKRYGLALLGGLANFEYLAKFYEKVEGSTPVSTGRFLKWADGEFLPVFYRVLQRNFFSIFKALKGSNLEAKPISQIAVLKRVALAATVDEDEEEEEVQEVRPSKRLKLQALSDSKRPGSRRSKH